MSEYVDTLSSPELVATNKREFLQIKLSEMSARSDQVSNAMQIALGFMISLTAALLAIMVSIGQTINENSCIEIQSANSFLDFLQALFQRENIILWIAAAVFAFIGSSSNLIALAIHENAEDHYNRIGQEYQVIAKELVGADTSFANLPDLKDRIMKGVVNSIYLRTACAFHFLFSVFLACFLESIILCLISTSIDEASYLSVEFLIIIPLISIIIGVATFVFMRKKAKKPQDCG